MPGLGSITGALGYGQESKDITRKGGLLDQTQLQFLIDNVLSSLGLGNLPIKPKFQNKVDNRQMGFNQFNPGQVQMGNLGPPPTPGPPAIPGVSPQQQNGPAQMALMQALLRRRG